MEKLFDIDAKLFIEGLEILVVGDFISNDPLRPAMTGVYMGAKGDKMHMVATDGNKLALNYIPLQRQYNPEQSIIWNREEVMAYLKANKKASGTITLYKDTEEKGVIELNGKKTPIKLIDENYPDYERALPTEKGQDITVSKEKLLYVVENVGTFSGDTYGSIAITIFSKDSLLVSAKDPDFSYEAEASLPIEAQEDAQEGFIIGVIWKLFYPLIKSLVCERIKLRFTTSARAIASPCDKNFETLAIIMPIQLGDRE